jgi:hypothetical protein
MKTGISGKEAARVAEDMAKPGSAWLKPLPPAKPKRHQALSCHRLGPSQSERCLRVSDSLCLVMKWKAPTPDLEGHRKRLREALGNTLSDE